MSKATIEQVRQKHTQDVDRNRDDGVVEYTSRERQSDEVYEVTEGKHTLPGGKTIGPGHRFRPTEAQIQTGSLRNKARPLSSREMREVKSSRSYFAGADFAQMEADAAAAAAAAGSQRQGEAGDGTPEPKLADLPMADGTRRAAEEAGLVPADFETIAPTGADGQFTRKQIDELIAAKKGG